MQLIVFIVLLFVWPSGQLTVNNNDNYSHNLSGKEKRSNDQSVLKPKALFLCALKAKRIYNLRSVCQRKHELQQEAHHCSNRRLLMARIDHQLAKLQKLSMLALLQYVLQKVNDCNDGMSRGSSKVDDLRADIALLQEQLENMTSHRSRLESRHEELEEVRENLTEIVAENKSAINNVRNQLKNLSEIIEQSEERLDNFSTSHGNKTSHVETKNVVSLITCNSELASLITDELNCSVNTLPELHEATLQRQKLIQSAEDNYQILQNEIENCRSLFLQCQESDVCDRLQTTLVKANQSSAELQQVTDQLAGCSTVLTSLNRGVTRCESTLDRAHTIHHDLLVNVTTRRISHRQREQAVIDCETQLSTCQDNITVCHDVSEELEHDVAGCWADLDKWKFRTDLCEGQAAMLQQNINATVDFIGDLRTKLRSDRAELELCQDRLLYHKSSHVLAKHALGKLTPELNASRASLAACLEECPHLQKESDNSRCPSGHHGLTWHQGTTGCFLVTRPGAGHSRMQHFCSEQAPGAGVARLSSETMALEAYEALLQRYMSAARTEPLRRLRRAWVDFEDGFEFAGYPAKSPQCQLVMCACWTMRFPWKGRSQLYECEEANLPAICYVPLVDG